MKEKFIELRNLENKLEKEYLDSVEKYFSGSKKFDILVEEIEKIVQISATDKNNLISTLNEPAIFVSNHPRPDRSICIPANKIQDKKGGNTFNFDRFHYPLINQLMIKKLLNKPFSTITLDVGWREAMEDCWCMVTTRSDGKHFNEIVSKYIPGQSIVIYPEGKSSGCTDLLPFHTGFFHLANILGLKKIALGISSPVLSLAGENNFTLIDIIQAPPKETNSHEFTKDIQIRIARELKEKYLK